MGWGLSHRTKSAPVLYRRPIGVLVRVGTPQRPADCLLCFIGFLNQRLFVYG